MTHAKKIPLPLFFIFVASLLPVLLGSLLYFFHGHYHLKQLNKGTLLNTPINMKDMWIGSTDAGKWRIVYVHQVLCDAQCTQRVNQLQQVQKALGKNRERVRVMNVDSTLAALNTKLLQSGDKNLVASNKIYLVDPIGNLFMYYPNTTDPMNVYKDLKRLLEVSQIG